MNNNAPNGNSTTVGEKELTTIRILDAPRKLVFEAWTNPKHLAQWWGPKGFTNTFQVFDFRPGGTWEFIMHGPDGVDYKNKHIFVEIVKPERIVLQHVSGPRFRATVTFEELDDKTKLVYHMLFETTREFDGVKPYAIDGNKQTFDRLEALLRELASK